MQGNTRSNNNNMYGDEKSLPKFLICLGFLEIIIAAIAATGLGLNVLASSNGVADIRMSNTSAIIGHYYAHVDLKTDGYYFSGHMQNSSSTNSQFYSYKSSYQTNCGTGMPSLHSHSQNSSRSDCDVRYGIWQWSRAYTALGIIAIIIVFITGVVVLFLGCCGELLSWCCCGNNSQDRHCCSGLFACATEWWLLVLNFLVFVMFAFTWGIILGMKFNTHLTSILDNEANQALNNKKNTQTYDFDFDKVSIGRSLWPLAAADLLALMVTLYLLIMMCCGCCRNCQNCDERMRCNCDDMMYSNTNNNNKRNCRNSTIEMACDDVQV